MTYRHRQDVRARTVPLAVIGLMIGLLWAGIGLTLWHDHGIAEREAAGDAANMARAFGENITRTVEAVDQTLQFLRLTYQFDPAAFTTGSWATGRAFLDELHVQMALARSDGSVFWSNLAKVSSDVSIVDRTHFLVQRQSTADELYISRPVLGRVSGKWTIQFTRKLLAPDGSFAGVAVVSLDPHYLSQFYESLSIGAGAILLMTTDGTVLAKAPGELPGAGQELPAATRHEILIATTKSSTRPVRVIDQTKRIIAARRLEHYPLIVVVGLASKDVFAAYERNKRLYFAAGLLLTVAGIIAGVVMQRQGAALVASRQALSATLESMSQGIAMIEADGSVPVLNRRAIELLGLPAELIGPDMRYQRIVEWQKATNEYGEEATWSPALARVLRPDGNLRSDYTYERSRPNGTVLQIRTKALPDGAFVRTFTDITERKRNEAALATARAAAAHAERMQVLGRLAGGIAHDFNNILQAVQGSASLIAKRADDPESVRRFARMLLDATERGSSITRRLLAFARRGELRAEAVEAQPLLSALQEVLSHTLGRGIDVRLLVEDGLPPLLADKGQLETVLVNLANNARDAMPDGGRLTLGAALDVVEGGAPTEVPAELAAGRYVRLSVADTGTGMDDVTLARALEPFFSTKPTGHGTGLGLSMAKGFVEQSGGGLSIATTEGVGTTVRLWLPATARVEQTLVPAPPPMIAAAGRHILLVDDEATVRETLATSLQEAGYCVRLAKDGETALAVLESDASIDMLVTDLSMPGMDGLAVIRKARRYRPDLPAMLLTGYTGHGAQLAVGELLNGAFLLVHKPVTATQLVDRIEALLAVVQPG